MAQMLVELSGSPIPPSTVDKVAQLAQEADPKITPMKVKAISEMVESLSKEVPPEGIELVSSMVEKMGPVLSHRETQMISRMAARSGIELTMSDIHILSDIANSVGNDLTTNDIEIISVLTKKAGDENADLSSKPNGDNENDSKLSMTVRLKKPTEKPRGEPDDNDSDDNDTDDASNNSDFGMKENSNKQRKQPMKFANFSPNENVQPTTTQSPSPVTVNSNIRIRRPQASKTTTTTSTTSTTPTPLTAADEDILKNSDVRRRRPVPLRLAPVRPSDNQQEEVETTTTTTTITTTTTTTDLLSTTSRQKSTGKPQRFNSPSDAATMLNNALGNPVGNSFMQFFMGNKELNNFKFDGDKVAATTTTLRPPNDDFFSENSNGNPTEASNFMKLLVGGQDLDIPKIQEFEKLVKTSDEQISSTVSLNFDQLSTTQSPVRDVDTFNFNPDSSDLMENQEIKNSEFPDFATMLNGEPTPTNNPQASQDLSRFRTTNNFQLQNAETPTRANPSNVNPQSALMNFLLKTNLKEPGATLPTSFDPFVRETTTLDRTPSGNFMQILMGHQRLNGVDEKSNQLLKKLEKKKIPLDTTGDNFMAFSIGDQVYFRKTY